jgi:hypothetical protein
VTGDGPEHARQTIGILHGGRILDGVEGSLEVRGCGDPSDGRWLSAAPLGGVVLYEPALDDNVFVEGEKMVQRPAAEIDGEEHLGRHLGRQIATSKQLGLEHGPHPVLRARQGKHASLRVRT